MDLKTLQNSNDYDILWIKEKEGAWV